MAFDPGSLTSALAVAAGEDRALIAELRAAFLESARRHMDLLARARCDANWQLAAGRLKGLAASFGMSGLVEIALEAEAGAPGDPVVQRKIAQAIAELAG
jgi:HPt (histidine-containing phosphotransfer) domain-containing protein